MNLSISSHYYDVNLRKLLYRCKNPFAKLVDMSVHYFQCVDFLPPVYAFIINTGTLLHKETNTFFFVIYTKIPERQIMHVGEYLYSSLYTCQSDAVYYLKYFPLYGNLTRNKLETRWINSL